MFDGRRLGHHRAGAEALTSDPTVDGTRSENRSIHGDLGAVLHGPSLRATLVAVTGDIRHAVRRTSLARPKSAAPPHLVLVVGRVPGYQRRPSGAPEPSRFDQLTRHRPFGLVAAPRSNDPQNVGVRERRENVPGYFAAANEAAVTVPCREQASIESRGDRISFCFDIDACWLSVNVSR
jgi:hypothetical protein